VNSDHQSFAPTRWTLIQRAQGETAQARAALAELCETYYDPVLHFLRREGRDGDTARDLTQEFFARILAGSGFGEAHRDQGRFRSYLLGALRHFLADERKHQARLKRGGGVPVESLDASDSDGGGWLQVSDTSSASPEAAFDRQWALTVIARATATLEREFTADGKAGHFDALKGWLVDGDSSMSQAQAAQRLGLSEGAVKVAIHRLRKRLREAVRAEISQTLRDQTLIDQELRHLISALS
jgi:RNA polymerase sigma factor (sigma-70 family)